MRPPHLLALSDGLHVALAMFQLAFSAVVSVTLFRLTAWQRRYEGLDARLQEAASRLVDERFRGMTHEVRGHVQSFMTTLDELRGRVASGDGALRDLTDRDQRIELALGARVDTLKDWIRDHAANKTDLARHEAAFERKCSHVEQRLAELSNTVAVLTERVRE
jgi:ABC-type transporter Mla subunit MlaD